MEALDRRVGLGEVLERGVDRDDVGVKEIGGRGAAGPKSRGGVVTVVGGPNAPPCWASAPPAETAVAPAAIARPWTRVRREIIDCGSRCTSRFITSSHSMRRPVDPAVGG